MNWLLPMPSLALMTMLISDRRSCLTSVMSRKKTPGATSSRSTSSRPAWSELQLLEALTFALSPFESSRQLWMNATAVASHFNIHARVTGPERALMVILCPRPSRHPFLQSITAIALSTRGFYASCFLSPVPLYDEMRYVPIYSLRVSLTAGMWPQKRQT